MTGISTTRARETPRIKPKAHGPAAEGRSLHDPLPEDDGNPVFDPLRPAPARFPDDARRIASGWRIPGGLYSDQPYPVKTRDGAWLCVMTIGGAEEGRRGQHIVSMRSTDRGRTWDRLVPIESPEGPEASWAVPIVAPGGRIFVFYVFNLDDLRQLPADDPPFAGGFTERMDSHGYFVFRWSDDHGRSWSHQRGTIPVRAFALDHANPTGGEIRLFWNVGLPFVHESSVVVPLHKVGGFGEGWFVRSEGALVRSSDLFRPEMDPLGATWETLPDGEEGIRAPHGAGPIAEEQSFVVLSDGSLFTMFRTIAGHPGCSYSRDGGRTWTPADFPAYRDGRKIKNPRAATFVWKREDGSYLCCHHNHGGTPLGRRADARTFGYQNRNPLWLSRGWEEERQDGIHLVWSQPEIALYDEDPLVRISYPGLIEEGHAIYLSATQKQTARIHRLPEQLRDALSPIAAERLRRLAEMEPLFEWHPGCGTEVLFPASRLPSFVERDHEAPYGSLRTRLGFSIELHFANEPAPGSTLLYADGCDGSSIRICAGIEEALRFDFDDGQTRVAWNSGPETAAARGAHWVVSLDSGPCLVLAYRNGMLLDGGERRQFGWQRFSPHFRNAYADAVLRLTPCAADCLRRIVIWPKCLTSAEVCHLADQSKIPSAAWTSK